LRIANSCRETTVCSYYPTEDQHRDTIRSRSRLILHPTEADRIIGRYERPVEKVEPTVSDPILQEMDGILDDPQLLALVRRDLRWHYRPVPYRRHSVPVEVLLRLTVLRRVKRWSYRQTEQEVRASQPYRWWVQGYEQRVRTLAP
jgi:hypothetical protein